MREILFKAKRLDNGEWVEGAYCKLDSKQNAIPHIVDYAEGDNFGDWIEVIPATVCQDTGLTDKNGVKIFEGDILDENRYCFTVVYDQKTARFKLRHDGKAIQYPEWNRGILMEVIGNIHDKEQSDG